MSGGKKYSNVSQRLNDVQIQSSVYGSAIARVWGTAKVSANLIWYGDFKAIAHTEKQKTGGKGGGGGSISNTTYTYTAGVMMSLCRGPIDSVRTVYRDQSVFKPGSTTALSQAGLSLANGAFGQAPWGYLTTYHPAEAVGYSLTAYVYASDYSLGDNATLSNHSFEVVSTIRETGMDDANPQAILEDFIPSVPLWPAGALADLSDYGNYCLAANLLLSPVLDSQRQASDFVAEILQASNSDCVWSDGKLKIFPLGDTAISGNGTTWYPDLTPIYDLTLDDFIRESDDDPPVRTDMKRPADASNYVTISFSDRARNYATNSVPGIDKASIEEFGRRNGNPITLNCIKVEAIASALAQIIVQRVCYARATHRFQLPWNYCLLDPGDLVTITTETLDRVLVRISEFNEAPDGSFDVEAEEMLVGTSVPAEINRAPGTGYQSNFDVPPGNVTQPLILNPPRALTNGALEVWVATAGGPYWGGCEVWASMDGTSYELQGQIEGKSRYGLTTSALAVSTDPDTTHSVGLNLGISGGTLDAGSVDDADNLNTLCVLGSEIIAYSAATLTGTNLYTLGSYIRRGCKGTTPATQPLGSAFVRLDQAVFAIPYRDDQIGKSIFVKFKSFNVYGRAAQDLDDVATYTFTLTPSTAGFTVVDWDTIANRPPVVVDLNPDGTIKPIYVDTGGGQNLTDWKTATNTLLLTAQADATAALTAIFDPNSGAKTRLDRLSAKGTGAINPNGDFSEWPGTLPDKVSAWIGSGGTKSTSTNFGGDVLDVTAGAAVDGGFLFAYNVLPTPSPGTTWFVIEADFELVAGSLDGSGLYVAMLDSTLSTTVADKVLSFKTLIGAGTLGKAYRFRSEPFEIPYVSTQAYMQIYGMNHWSSHAGGVAVPNRIKWDRVELFAASDIEASYSHDIGVLTTDSLTAAAEITTLKAQRRQGAPNRLINGDFSNGFNGWELGGSGMSVGIGPVVGNYMAFGTGAPILFIFQDVVFPYVGEQMSLSVEGDTGSPRCGYAQLQYLDSAKTTVLAASPFLACLGFGTRVSTGPMTSPAGTAYIRVALVKDGVGNPAFTRVQLQQGVSTDWSFDTAKAEAISTALVNTTSSIATYNNTVSTSYGGLSATASGTFTAVSTLNGQMAAGIGLRVSAGRINGYIGLTAGGGGSAFDVEADYFRVWNGTSSVPAFEVSGGAAYIAGQKVRTQSIVPDAVSATVATTGDYGGSYGNGGGGADVCSVTIVGAGRLVLIQGMYQARQNAGPGNINATAQLNGLASQTPKSGTYCLRDYDFSQTFFASEVVPVGVSRTYTIRDTVGVGANILFFSFGISATVLKV